MASRPAAVPLSLPLAAPWALLLVVVLLVLSPSLPGASASAEDPVMAFVKETIRDNPLAIFSKSYCPYCRRAKQVFRDLGATPFVVELDQREDGSAIQDALLDLVGRRSVPQVFVGGEHIGGSDDTVEAYESGKLKGLVEAALGQREL